MSYAEKATSPAEEKLNQAIQKVPKMLASYTLNPLSSPLLHTLKQSNGEAWVKFKGFGKFKAPEDRHELAMQYAAELRVLRDESAFSRTSVIQYAVALLVAIMINTWAGERLESAGIKTLASDQPELLFLFLSIAIMSFMPSMAFLDPLVRQAKQIERAANEVLKEQKAGENPLPFLENQGVLKQSESTLGART